MRCVKARKQRVFHSEACFLDGNPEQLLAPFRNKSGPTNFSTRSEDLYCDSMLNVERVRSVLTFLFEFSFE